MPQAPKHACMQWLDTNSFAHGAAPDATATDAVQLCLWRDATADPAGAAAQARARLQRTLADQLGTDAEALRFRRGPHGKPALDPPASLHYNLSHSGAVTALALAHDLEVGVDVEVPRRSRDVLALAQRYFAAPEAALLAHLAAPAREAAFHALWTCKEAVLKALGRGIAFGLHRLEFELDPASGQPRGLARIDQDGGLAATWRIFRFEPVHGGFGALAWNGPERRVHGIWPPAVVAAATDDDPS